MKKIALSLIALAAVSSAAFAERNYDLRSSPEAQGSFSVPGQDVPSGSTINTLQVEDVDSPVVYFGKYGTTADPLEARRWDEKSGG